MPKERYFIAICPPEPIKSEVRLLKEGVCQKYGSKGALRSTAHITLQMPFIFTSKKIPSLITSLESFAIAQKQIPIQLNNFEGFEPRIIYIKVNPSEELNQVQKDLELLLKKFQIFSATHKNRGFNPHITIAFRDLKKVNFYQAAEDFYSRTYEKQWIANSIILMKHNGTIWEEYKEFGFG